MDARNLRESVELRKLREEVSGLCNAYGTDAVLGALESVRRQEGKFVERFAGGQLVRDPGDPESFAHVSWFYGK